MKSRNTKGTLRSRVAIAAVTAGLVVSLGALAPAAAIADEQVAPQEALTQQEAKAEDVPAATDKAATADAAEPADDAAAAPQEDANPTPVANPVARFNGQDYDSFDAALAAASSTDGATIELLADAQTKGLNLSRDLTIDGAGHSLTFTDKGIALWGHGLVLKNVNASMSGVGSTPYTAEWKWMSVCASKDASLTLDAASLSMDGAGTGQNVHAIYFCSNNKLNLRNGSNLTIKNYGQDALEWDGGDGGYNVNIEGGSTYTSDHNRSGFTGTFTASVDASTVNVTNSTGNGSNGSHFDIKNGSVVDFSDNGDHGLSAGNLSIANSKVTANNNGRNGIIFTGKGQFTNADVQVTGTLGKSYWNAGIRLMKKNASLDVDAASKVSITGNHVTGLFLDAGAHATFAEGAALTITGNDASQANCSTKKDLAQMGGGVVVRSGANLTLPNSAVIDNNNAALAGDDVYVEAGGSILLGATHNEDALNGFGGCGHAIDSWYDDAADARWSAHGDTKHVKAVEAGSFQGQNSPIALKAAHGLVNVNYQYVGTRPNDVTLPAPDEGLEVGASYTAKAQAAVDGWTFDGWYADEACTAKWEDGAELTGSMTLYGKWTQDPVAPSAPQTPGASDAKPAGKELPQTGDSASAAPLALLAGATAALTAGLTARRRSR
ncbi:InlB B-repeat-containing protein [uncultured Parolsenella sp.]|uniref:InlB B-repeat-containing protein n=1 Tax=uncultured Parolsenella sp. TaxID=2083008 RepID=UPI002593C247|nr:InlB B-repeat-containing protein [uncultured Parolsenella sp.]